MRLDAIGPDKINGLPAHVLLVHVVVVIMPLAAVCLVASAWWPAARRRLGVVTPLLALVSLAAVPVTTHAGEWLADHLGGQSPLLRKHEHLGRGLLPWAIALFVVSAAVYAWHRWGRALVRTTAADEAAADGPSSGGGTAVLTRPRTGQTTVVDVVLGVLAVVVAVVAVYEVYRVGDSGAKAVWSGTGGS